jgi:hypothetical protein
MTTFDKNTFKPDSRAILVPCIFCDAKPGENCRQPGRTELLVGGYHKQRIELSNKLVPHYPSGEDLDATDKALITYMAFIMLADAVSVSAIKMFGKETTSVEIQKFFGRKAIDQLRVLGLLKK